MKRGDGRRVFVIMAPGFLLLGLAMIGVSLIDSWVMWITERSTTQTATEYARPSSFGEIQGGLRFVGGLFIFIGLVFVWVSRLEVDTGSPDVTVDLGGATLAPGTLAGLLQQAQQAGASPAPPAPTPGSDLGGQLAQLSELHRQGALSDDEFAAAKARLLES